MMWVADIKGLVPVQEQDISPRDRYPVRLVTITESFGEWSTPREVAYETVQDAITDLEYAGQEFEDIKLLWCEGADPRELGFPIAY